MCNAVGSTTTYACEPKDFCNDPGVQWQIDYSDQKSLYNWVEKLSLVCRPQWQVGLLGSSVFIGTVMTFFLPVLSDKYGRKSFFQVGVTINLIAYTFIMINTHFWTQCVLLLIVGLNSPTTYVIGFGYLQELVGNDHKAIYATIWNLSEGLIFVISTLYYWKINRHWVYILSVGYLMNWICFFGAMFLPESPVFLINSCRLGEAQKSFEYIARVNKKDLKFDEDLFPEKQTKQVAEDDATISNIGESTDTGTLDFETQTVVTEAVDKTTTKYYLTIPSIRRNLTIMMLCWLTASFNYFMLSFLIKYFPGNIYANGLMSSISEMSGDLTIGLIYAKIGTKATYYTTLGLATLGGLGMVYYELSTGFFGDNPDHRAAWMFPALVLICKFGTSAVYNVNYISNFDLFPSVFAVSALGFGDFLGSFVTIFAPEVAEL